MRKKPALTYRYGGCLRLRAFVHAATRLVEGTEARNGTSCWQPCAADGDGRLRSAITLSCKQLAVIQAFVAPFSLTKTDVRNELPVTFYAVLGVYCFFSTNQCARFV